MTNLLAQSEKLVGPNSCKVSHSQGRLVARNVVSDLLLVLYERNVKLGMMLRSGENQAELAFAEAALELFFSEFQTMGIQTGQMTVHAIGGSADSLAHTRLRRLLSSRHIRLTGSDLGQNQNRSAWLALESGRLIVRANCVPRISIGLEGCSDRLAS